MKQCISIILLFTLAWSCSGLNLGMIGHQMTMDSAGDHECCVGMGSGMESGHEETLVHHNIVATTSDNFMVMLFLVTLGIRFFFQRQPTSLHIYFKRYMRHWRERFSYFALYLTRQFSAGILHPKIW